jgi:hypothetical protein
MDNKTQPLNIYTTTTNANTKEGKVKRIII